MNDWILTAPGSRAVWLIEKSHGRWRVGVSVFNDLTTERIPAGEGDAYEAAVADAIEKARLAGYS